MKKPYKIILLRLFNEELSIVKEIETNNISKIMKINGNTYHINIKDVSYIKEHQRYYFINIDNANQYTFNEIEAIMNPKDLDNLFSTKIIRELTSGILDNKKEKILFVVIGFIIGLILGLLIMQILMSGKIEEILTNQTTPVIPPFSTSLKLFWS